MRQILFAANTGELLFFFEKIIPYKLLQGWARQAQNHNLKIIFILWAIIT